jgi:hypothetical protein
MKQGKHGGQIVGVPLVEMQRPYYEDVRLEPYEGTDYLVAREVSIDPAHFDIAEPTVLLSFVNLVEEPDRWTKRHLSRTQSEMQANSLKTTGESSPEFRLAGDEDRQWWRQTSGAWVPPEAVLKWCGDHGLPEAKLRRLGDQGRFCAGLLLHEFQEQTLHLYLLYQLWHALSVEDPHMIDCYLQALTPSYLPRPRTSRHGAERKLSESVNTYIHLAVRLTFRNNPPGFLWTVGPSRDIEVIRFLIGDMLPGAVGPSLFSVAYLELGFLITREPDEAKKRIKQCAWCRSVFWGHGNRLYCDKCDRRTVHSRIKRSQVTGE